MHAPRYTAQNYERLNYLYDKYRSRGLEVGVGFPRTIRFDLQGQHMHAPLPAALGHRCRW